MTRPMHGWWICGCALTLGAVVGCGDDAKDSLFGADPGARPTGGTAPVGDESGGTETGGAPTGGDPGPGAGGTQVGGAETGGDSIGASPGAGGDGSGGASASCASNAACPVGTICVLASGSCLVVACSGVDECAAYGATCDAGAGLCVAGSGTGGTGGDATGGAGGVETGGAETGGAGIGGGDCTSATMSPCTSIPRFDGTQTVDGNDADVCSLPMFTLDFGANQGYVHVDHPGAESDRAESLQARLGWSEAGLHGFITVTDPFLLVAGGGGSDLTQIWNGDGVEVFVASDAGSLTGNSGSDPVTHAQFASSPGVAASVKTSDGSASHTALPASEFSTAVVAGGYVIEFLLPWSGGAPASGATIGFDLALNSGDGSPADSPDGRDAQAVLYLGDPGGGSTCGGAAVEPWCDDRTWCKPTLQ